MKLRVLYFLTFMISMRGTNGIKNGRDIDRDVYPYFVGIKSVLKNKIICGGVIWRASQVITSYHCVSNQTIDYQVCVGSHTDHMSLCLDVIRVIKHPEYDSMRALNPHDIALVVMDPPFSTHYKLCQIRLPTLEKHTVMRQMIEYRPKYDDVTPKTKGLADMSSVGFGTTRLKSKGNERNRHLQEATQLYGIRRHIYYNAVRTACDRLICTVSGDETYQMTCSGDSGSPLIWTHNNVSTVIGLITYAIPTFEKGYCSEDKEQPVSLDVDLFLNKNFIEQHTAGPHLSLCPTTLEERNEWDSHKWSNLPAPIDVNLLVICLVTFVVSVALFSFVFMLLKQRHTAAAANRQNEIAFGFVDNTTEALRVCQEWTRYFS